MQVAVPGLGADVDVAVVVHVCCIDGNGAVRHAALARDFGEIEENVGVLGIGLESGLGFFFQCVEDEGADCLLNIERYWVNVDVSPDVFVLAPPN